MGLLDSIGALAGQLGSGQNGDQNMADPKAALVQAVIGMLNSGNSGSGGLAGLVQQFSKAGLGDIMSSWISTGKNLPVSADQINNALGNGQLQQIASQLGLSSGDTAHQLSDLLPGLIDKLTPQGQVPQGGLDAGSIQNALGGLLGQFLGKSA